MNMRVLSMIAVAVGTSQSPLVLKLYVLILYVKMTL